MKKQIFTWTLVIFLVPLLACSLGGGDESASSQVSLEGGGTEEAAPTQPAVVEDVEEVKEETPTPEPTPVPEPEAVEFPGVIGVDQFDTYQMKAVMEFTRPPGEATGDEVTEQRQETFLEVIKEPEIWHQTISIQSTGGTETNVERETYYVDDVTYNLTFDSWTAMGGLMGRSQFTGLGLYVLLPETALCDPEIETVNDIPAIHCTFTEADKVSESLDAQKVDGDVWIAEDGGYVLKYEMYAEQLDLKGAFSGGYEIFDTYSLSYELVDINSDLSISLPPEAQGVAVNDVQSNSTSGVAVPDSAEVFLDSEYGTNYFSTAGLQELVDFHMNDLSASWEAITDESYVSKDFALLVFKGDEEGFLRVYLQQDLAGAGYFASITMPYEAPGLSGADSGTGTGAGASSSDFPVLDDAEEITSLGGFVTYYSATDIPTTIDFYRQELSAEGWEEDAAQTLIQPDTMGMMQFKKDTETIMVTITKEDDGRTNVIVVTQ